MAQRIPTLISVAPMLALLLQGMSASAQDTPAIPPPDGQPVVEETLEKAPPPPPEKEMHRKFKRGGWQRDGEEGRRPRPPRDRLSPEALEKLSPEERKHFLENLERWKKLPPERRDSLRSRELFRRQRIEKETKETLEKSGVSLSESQRNFFIKRYEAERRQLENDLRKEMDEKRKKGIEELSARLLKEAQDRPVETPKPEETKEAPPAPPAENTAAEPPAV